jgi:hypothetical protein
MPLLKLLPEQIMERWLEIRASIQAALPPHAEWNDASILRIQEQLLIGEMDCWYALRDGRTQAIVVTRVGEDPCSSVKHLLIFTLTAVEDHYSETWREGFSTLRKYALSRDCRKIIAYTKYEKFIDLARRFDADCEWRMILVEL